VVRLGRTVRIREEDYKIFIDANTDDIAIDSPVEE
jgi:hypothetical protein